MLLPIRFAYIFLLFAPAGVGSGDGHLALLIYTIFLVLKKKAFSSRIKINKSTCSVVGNIKGFSDF